MPEEEVIRALLPEAKLLKGDSGELVMQMDGAHLLRLSLNSADGSLCSSAQAVPSSKELLAANRGMYLERSSQEAEADMDGLQEASRRGDSMELSTLKQYLKVSAATWVLQLAAGMVSAELEEMGLGDARKGLGLGNATRRGWMRAEWAGLSLR